VRNNFLLLPLLLAGCGPGDARPPAGPAAGAVTPDRGDDPARGAAATAAVEEGLYSDAEIERLAGAQAERLRGGEAVFLLSVIPEGENLPLGQAFRDMRIEERRLHRLPLSGINNVIVLEWQASPGYRLTAMTSRLEPLGDRGLAGLYEPDRRVYGIRLEPGEEPPPDSEHGRHGRLAAPVRRPGSR
jgi:hypothetical protein